MHCFFISAGWGGGGALFKHKRKLLNSQVYKNSLVSCTVIPVTRSPKILCIPLPPLQRRMKLISLLPEIRCPLFPRHLQFLFPTLLSGYSCSILSVLSSPFSSSAVNANLPRGSNQGSNTLRGCSAPTGHTRPGRTLPALPQPGTRRNRSPRPHRA